MDKDEILSMASKITSFISGIILIMGIIGLGILACSEMSSWVVAHQSGILLNTRNLLLVALILSLLGTAMLQGKWDTIKEKHRIMLFVASIIFYGILFLALYNIVAHPILWISIVIIFLIGYIIVGVLRLVLY